MALGAYAHTFFGARKLEKRNHALSHELRSYWPAKQRLKILGAKRKVLFDLNNTHAIFPAFCLHRQNIMRTVLVESDVNLIRFNLPKSLNAASQMTLQGISRETSENVDEPVIT